MDTSIYSNLSWLHILVAAIAYFALGAVWYSPLFGKKWVAYHQIDINQPNARQGMVVIMTVSFIWMFIISAALAVLVGRLGMTEALSGAKLGLFTGLCFSAASVSINHLYLKKPMGLHMIDGMYHVVGQIIVAVILCTWR